MRLAVLWLLGACSYKPSVALQGDGEPQPPDTLPPTDVLVLPDAPCSFSTQFDTCAFAPSIEMDPSDKLYDTATHVLSDLDGTNPMVLGSNQQMDVMGKAGIINVLLVTELNLAGGKTFRIVGNKAFGIVSTGGITIDGVLDGSSERAPLSNPNINLNGPGSLRGEDCGTATPPDPGDHIGAGGGGGGAFGGGGGFGQTGNGGAGAIGGIAPDLPRGPRGGCPGGIGGANSAGTAAASEGGRGGGAIYLVAAEMIEVKGGGRIAAGGAGGAGGNLLLGGGAGGGSGGMILLEAPMVKIGGMLTANGGGGGGGAGGTGAGGNGGNANISDTTAAGGGSGFGPGGTGETGSVGSEIKGTDNDNAVATGGAGGGGGGGAGVISIKSAAAPILGGNARFSPARVTLPN